MNLPKRRENDRKTVDAHNKNSAAMGDALGWTSSAGKSRRNKSTGELFGLVRTKQNTTARKAAYNKVDNKDGWGGYATGQGHVNVVGKGE